MLYIDPDEVKIVPAGVTQCAECKERKASWGMKRDGGEEPEPYCGWCLMYGSSEWGRLNREELVAVGEYVRGFALKSKGLNTHVPELDEMHRLGPDAADRFVMGVVSTSRKLAEGPMGRMTSLGARLRDEAEE